MENKDYDEDIYEETTSKVVFKRRSSALESRLKKSGSGLDEKSRVRRSERRSRQDSAAANEEWKATATIRLKGQDQHRSRETMDSHQLDSPRRWSSGELHASTSGRYRGDRSVSKKSRSKSTSRLFEDQHRRRDPGFQVSPKVEKNTRDWAERNKMSDFYLSERVEEETRDWSERAKEESRQREMSKGGTYYPVDKWEVDYNNQNFVRSKCIKPKGMHRFVYGRPFNWEIDYDNRYFLKSKVDYSKGFHREVYEFKRKRVPDNDDLGDATGWQFEWGPEYDQIEGDYPFYPRERIVGKGGYHFYGVRRNKSDTGGMIEETDEEIPEIIEEDYKYGHEFLQDDVPHIVNFKDMRIGRGAYRFTDVARNRCDKRPNDILGLDYRISQISLRKDLREIPEPPRKGKPFKQTIFKKTFKLVKPPSPTDFKHGTVISFVPGVGSKTSYEGKSTRPSVLIDTSKKYPNLRNVFHSKKRVSIETGLPRKSSSDFNRRRFKSEESETRPPSSRYSVDEFRQGQAHQRQEGKQERRRHGEESKERHKFPSDVQDRINEIRNLTQETSSGRHTNNWKGHENHPYDTGKSITEGYEKFVNERGSEIWIKKEEKYSEFHHKRLN